ncbi:MAG: sulfotransferase [Nitrosomonas sp.]|nr:MAG: sulfotransferase [Nitrosomonas sp.]
MNNGLFFIIASPRSGTTLLERLLNRHSRLYVPPETAFFTYLKRSGLFDQKYNAEAMKKFIPTYLGNRKFLNLERVPDVEKHLLQDAKTHGDVFLNLLALLQKIDSKKPRIGEKTPHHLAHAEYLLNTFPEARFLAIIRDGRAVVRSRLAHPNWEHNLVGAAKFWRKDARLLQKIKSGPHNERIHIIRYEKLISHPEETLKEVCIFLEEKFEPTMLEENNTASISYQEYYQQPWMAKSNSPIDPGRANAWIEEYKLSELALVEQLIKPELQYFNYELMAPPDIQWRVLFAKEWVRHYFFRIHKRLSGMLK